MSEQQQRVIEDLQARLIRSSERERTLMFQMALLKEKIIELEDS